MTEDRLKGRIEQIVRGLNNLRADLGEINNELDRELIGLGDGASETEEGFEIMEIQGFFNEVQDMIIEASNELAGNILNCPTD